MRLVGYDQGHLTQDSLNALSKLEAEIKAKLPGHKLVASVRAEQGDRSLARAGREVRMRLYDPEGKEVLPKLWGLAIPLGWTPWERYPEGGSDAYHYFGVWSLLMDHLVGTGRGEAGWPSVCAAAQCEVGKWEGTHPQERRIQSLLHLQGLNPGPVDGIVGPLTQGILRSVGMSNLPLRKVLEKLVTMKPVPVRTFPKAVQGRWLLPDVHFSIHTFGSVRARHDLRGASVEIKGPGRILIDITGMRNKT